jgi:hypothetical protein
MTAQRTFRVTALIFGLSAIELLWHYGWRSNRWVGIGTASLALVLLQPRETGSNYLNWLTRPRNVLGMVLIFATTCSVANDVYIAFIK